MPDHAGADQQPDLLKIGEVAERVGLSLRTVRYYEEQGLLTPESRSDGGFRLFSESQVERLALIKQMKPLGFSLDEMRELLTARDLVRRSGEGKLSSARDILRRYAGRAVDESGGLRAQAEEGDRFAARLRSEADG